MHSSLPTGIKDSSYFDLNEQKRSLVNWDKAGTVEKDADYKVKYGIDPSFADCDVNLETDYDF